MEKQPKFDRAYFIAKFEAIPEEKWTTDAFAKVVGDSRAYCALGHCGQRYHCETKEANALKKICRQRLTWIQKHGCTSIRSGHTAIQINDGDGPFINLGDYPRARMLYFLKMPLKKLSEILQ